MSNYYQRTSIQQSSETSLYVFCALIFIGGLAVASGYTAEILHGARVLIDMVSGK